MAVKAREATLALLAADTTTCYLRTLGVPDTFSNMAGLGTANAGRVSALGKPASGIVAHTGSHSHYNIFHICTHAATNFAVPPPAMIAFETFFITLCTQATSLHRT
mmetsp:Transcript_27437/g.84216  ORF Transcript_27437/g.84216 Transcript_27437/m.84216 type:complete len:106 (+) Transcript_27437:850-1167(+)